MPSESKLPLTSRLAARAKRLMRPARRRWLRWHSFKRPLPQDWWSDFEQDFRSYCAASAPRSRHTEPDR